MQFMKIISAILFLAVVLAMPQNANAGFLLGYMLGSSNNIQQRQKVASDSGIPLFCLDIENIEEYSKCRTPSALGIGWVTSISEDSPNYRTYNSNQMPIRTFIQREWEMLQSIRNKEAKK